MGFLPQLFWTARFLNVAPPIAESVLESLGTGQKVLGSGPEQRGGGSSVFEPLLRGGSFNFQLPIGVGHPVFSFLWELAHI